MKGRGMAGRKATKVFFGAVMVVSLAGCSGTPAAAPSRGPTPTASKSNIDAFLDGIYADESECAELTQEMESVGFGELDPTDVTAYADAIRGVGDTLTDLAARASDDGGLRHQEALAANAFSAYSDLLDELIADPGSVDEDLLLKKLDLAKESLLPLGDICPA